MDGTCTLAFMGLAIASGAQDIYRLMGAQILIGAGSAAVLVSYTWVEGYILRCVQFDHDWPMLQGAE